MTCKAPPAPPMRPSPGSPKITRSPHIFDVHQAIVNRDIAEIHRMTQHDLDLGWPVRGTTALSLAVYRGYLEAVRVLVRAGAPLDRRSRDHLDRLETPLISAIRLGHWDIFEELVSRGASLHIRDFYNQTPLWFAVKEQRAAFVGRLLSCGAPIRYTEAAGNPLNLAVQHLGYRGRREMALELVSAGLPLTHEDYRGRSPLYWAHHHRDLTFFTLLVQGGAPLRPYKWLLTPRDPTVQANNQGPPPDAAANQNPPFQATNHRRANESNPVVSPNHDSASGGNDPSTANPNNSFHANHHHELTNENPPSLAANRSLPPGSLLANHGPSLAWHGDLAVSHWLTQEVAAPPPLKRQIRTFIRAHLRDTHCTDVRPLLRALTLPPCLPLPPPLLSYLSLEEDLAIAA